MAQKAHAVFLNPHSNAGRGLKRWNRLLETNYARDFGLHQVPVFDGPILDAKATSKSELKSQLKKWISFEVKKGSRNFVAAGGDGTLHLLINSMIELSSELPEVLQCQIGAVGLGSSNDFHKPYQAQLLQKSAGVYCRLDFDSAHFIDIGQAELCENRIRYFILNSSVGVTAQANQFFNETQGWFSWLKQRSVSLSILVAAFREWVTFKGLPVQVTYNEQSIQGVISNIGMIKSPHFAGSFRYDSYPDPNDGRLGVHICFETHPIRLLKTLISLSQGRFLNLPSTQSDFSRRIQIQSEVPFALELDGEVYRVKQALISVLPQFLKVCFQ